MVYKFNFVQSKMSLLNSNLIIILIIINMIFYYWIYNNQTLKMTKYLKTQLIIYHLYMLYKSCATSAQAVTRTKSQMD